MSVKTIVMILFSLVIWGSSLSADEAKQKQDTVQTLIAKVKSAPPSERRLLMNELKLKLRSMHENARKQVMLDLRRSFNKQQGLKGKNNLIKSDMQHQNSMIMNESKNMKGYMDMDAMSKSGMKPMPRQIPGMGY
ncbi:MAG TPA: hypothetical protein EYH57_01780 [Sulfurovum sp.]|nr:hypothetical protein [Sulfurovum sp.]